MPAQNSIGSRIRRHLAAPPAPRYGTADLIDLAYRLILERPADELGLREFIAALEAGRLDPAGLVAALRRSPERLDRDRKAEADAADLGRRWLGELHRVRLELTAMLPRARRILDLGGSCENRPEGALVAYGYPYPFERLTIVDLPRDDRHAIYKSICGDYREAIRTPLGPVDYVYTSLADLAMFPDASFDLVYSGQSIEHVSRDDADRACREVHRVLAPGGQFCLDTPNRLVTRVEFPHHWINPDHEYEYTPDELTALLRSHGFAIAEAKGLCRYERSVATGRFDYHEGIRNAHLYDEVDDCYVMYFRCHKAG